MDNNDLNQNDSLYLENDHNEEGQRSNFINDELVSMYLNPKEDINLGKIFNFETFEFDEKKIFYQPKFIHNDEEESILLKIEMLKNQLEKEININNEKIPGIRSQDENLLSFYIDFCVVFSKLNTIMNEVQLKTNLKDFMEDLYNLRKVTNSFNGVYSGNINSNC